MKKIDFNNEFLGFKDKEDILVGTGILLAFLNKYDTWHLNAVQEYQKLR